MDVLNFKSLEKSCKKKFGAVFNLCIFRFNLKLLSDQVQAWTKKKKTSVANRAPLSSVYSPVGAVLTSHPHNESNNTRGPALQARTKMDVCSPQNTGCEREVKEEIYARLEKAPFHRRGGFSRRIKRQNNNVFKNNCNVVIVVIGSDSMQPQCGLQPHQQSP